MDAIREVVDKFDNMLGEHTPLGHSALEEYAALRDAVQAARPFWFMDDGWTRDIPDDKELIIDVPNRIHLVANVGNLRRLAAALAKLDALK